MIHPASWLAAAAGFWIANIPGALLGAVLGYLLDRRLALHSWSDLLSLLGWQSSLGDERLRFLLLGRLAKCDGHVQAMHIQQAQDEMRRLGLNQQQEQLAQAAFRRGKQADDDLHKLLTRLQGQRGEVQSLLLSCWRMVAASGGASAQERRLILLWGQWLGWTDAQTLALTIGLGAARSALDADAAYRAALSLLGVTSACNQATIKRAYRRLLSRHHPDKQAGGGATTQQLLSATEMTRELRNAYALIREKQGFR